MLGFLRGFWGGRRIRRRVVGCDIGGGVFGFVVFG